MGAVLRIKGVTNRMRRFRGFDRFSRANIVRALFARDGARCRICSTHLDPSIADSDHPAATTIDHVFVIGDGGEIGDENRLQNLQLAHGYCNQQRVKNAQRKSSWFVRGLARACENRRSIAS